MLKMTSLAFIVTLLTSGPVFAANPSANQQSQKPNDKTIYITEEPDQTDIYAIPLDEDDEAQQRELNELEHPHSQQPGQPKPK